MRSSTISEGSRWPRTVETGGNNGATHEVNVNIATTANWNAGNYAVHRF